jgi:hypothetical protein
VQYREFYDATIVECMKLPLSLSVVDMATMRVAEGASERIGAELRTTMFERAMTQDGVVALATSFLPDAVMLIAVLALLFVFDPGLLLIGLTVIPLLAALAVRHCTGIRDDTSLGDSGVRLSIEAIRTATTNRTVLVFIHDRDLAAIADRVVTLTNPVSPGGPGVHRSTDLQQDGDLQEDGRR